MIVKRLSKHWSRMDYNMVWKCLAKLEFCEFRYIGVEGNQITVLFLKKRRVINTFLGPEQFWGRSNNAMLTIRRVTNEIEQRKSS